VRCCPEYRASSAISPMSRSVAGGIMGSWRR